MVYSVTPPSSSVWAHLLLLFPCLYAAAVFLQRRLRSDQLARAPGRTDALVLLPQSLTVGGMGEADLFGGLGERKGTYLVTAT